MRRKHKTLISIMLMSSILLIGMPVYASETGNIEIVSNQVELDQLRRACTKAG